MANVANLIVAVNARTAGLNAAFAQSTRRVQAFAELTESVGQRMSTVTVAAGLLGGAVIQATATLDGLKKGLEAAAGSAQEAAKQYERLRVIAKAPGINLEQAVKGSIQLQSVGASAQLAERTLKNVGRAVAASAGGAEQFGSVNRQLQQIAGAGRIAGEELNVIKESAPAIAKALQAAFGTTTAEGIRNLNLSTEEFFSRLNQGIEQTIPQVEGGLGNAIENLRSSFQQAFASLGSGQANQLTVSINNLATRVESLAASFARLSPGTQRTVIGFVALLAAAGPLLIGLSALANAYRTLAAISLVSTTIQATRAFIAQAAAVRSASAAMALATTAARGLAAAMMGPLGIVVAIGAAAAAWIYFKNKTNEAAREAENAAQRMTEALLGVDEAVARGMLTQKNVATSGLMRGMQQTREEIERTKTSLARLGVDVTKLETRAAGGPQRWLAGFGRDIATRSASPAVRSLIEQLEQQQEALTSAGRLLGTRLAEMKVLADDVNSRAQTQVGNDFADGTNAADADDDRFKVLRKQVETIAEGIRLRADDATLLRQGVELEEALARQAALTNQSLQDRVTLLSLSNALAEAGRSRLEGPAVNLDAAGTSRSTDTLTRGLEILNRQAAPIRAKMSGIAREAERAAKAIQRWENVTRVLDALSRALSQFGGFGRRLGEIVARVGDLTDAMRQLRDSQRDTGEKGIFGNISNLTSALGVAGAALGALKSVFGGLFGGGNDKEAEEQRRRLDANTEAMDRLAAKLNALAGTADEARRAQIAAGRLASRAGEIRDAAFGRENQVSFVNKMIEDLGISFADLKRLAEGLGISLIKDNGYIAADALDELAKALGYHTDIITKLANDLNGFRAAQDAAARLYNVEDTPQRALSEALAELRKFAPGLMEGVLSGIDVSGSGGREALQKALQALFERIRGGTISLSDLGTFSDVNQLLESLLRTDDALDRFREAVDKATASSLNVPQGFKVAREAFIATVADRERGAPYLPTQASAAPQSANAGPSTVIQMGAGAVPITIYTSGDGPETYANWYHEVQRQATANPAMRAWASTLTPPSRN